MNDIFIKHTIGELIDMQMASKISAAELEAIAKKNIAEVDSKYMAWVTLEKENHPDLYEVSRSANAEARHLEGVPVGVKDIYNTVHYKTQMGSPLWKDFTPGNDARAVFNIKRQGANVIGKTVTAEFAVHALDSTLNPYDITKTPGTSSSGSAVAVALGQVPFATASQTAGSIVRPASFCGVYGMKPSFGTVPRTGTLKTTDSLDSLGFISLHAADLKRGFDSMRVAGLDYPISNAALTDSTRQTKFVNRPWRVAFVKTHTWKHAPEYAQKAFSDFMQLLSREKEFEVIERELPDSMARSHEVHPTIYNRTLSYYFKNESRESQFVSPVMREMIAAGNDISLATYREAVSAQEQMIRDIDEWFSDCDVLVSLSTAGEAPQREVTELPDPSLVYTLAHVPVVSVPQFTSPSGLPFGMQIAARKYNDYLLLSFTDELVQKNLIPALGYYKKIYE